MAALMLLICHTQLLFLLVLSEFENCECQSGLFWSKGWRVFVFVMTGSSFTVHVKSEFGISNQINLSWLSGIWPCKHSYCVFTAVLDCSLMALLFQHHGQLFFSSIYCFSTADSSPGSSPALPAPGSLQQQPKMLWDCRRSQPSSLISSRRGGRQCITMGAQNKMKQYPSILQSVHFGNCSGPAERCEGSL